MGGRVSHSEEVDEDLNDWLDNSSNISDTAPEDEGILKVVGVDLKIKDNTKAHHTSDYDITDATVYDAREYLVIRRGQDFDVIVNLNRQFNEEKDDLKLNFQFGKRPLINLGTRADVKLSESFTTNSWGAYIKSQDDNSIKLVVTTPAGIAVGKWHLKIVVIDKTSGATNNQPHKQLDPIYILFNPWCKDDQVYLQETGLLEEYVLNESGRLWLGSAHDNDDVSWVFGQMSGNVLDCAFSILDISRFPDEARGNPVLVSRKLSALVNSNDDNGVLVGNWSGRYGNGTSPSFWTGSVAILDEYYQTKRPVKYGQCWVFSGVMTTLCRTLGIPTRSVTNFNSAHDTDGSITIDEFVDSDLNEIKHLNRDSVWNFHVWNDVWMARPDLPLVYGGWQAVDATPQETSQGIYRCGPMPLHAIKRGEVNLFYDGPFVFAEVNGDQVIWQVKGNEKAKPIKVTRNGIGVYMSTKKPLSKEREDVTDQYKYPEGSELERAAVRNANLHSTLLEGALYETAPKDVKLDIKFDKRIMIGENIEFSLVLTNSSTSKYTLHGKVAVDSMYYTGVFHKQIDTNTLEKVQLAPEKGTTIPIKVTVKQYLPNLMDHCILRISCLCVIKETEQVVSEIAVLRLKKPNMDIKAPSSAVVGRRFEVDVSFQNPLPLPLRDCELRVEGPGLKRPKVYPQPAVAANGHFKGLFHITPVKPGKREIVVCFNSNRISSISVSKEIEVTKSG